MGRLGGEQGGHNFGHSAVLADSDESGRKLLKCDAVYNYASAPVAQLDRAIASGAIGREFESLRARQLMPILRAAQDFGCGLRCAHARKTLKLVRPELQRLCGSLG